MDKTNEPKSCKYFNGVPIILTNVLGKTIQRRKHKKRRINKKWAKRYGYKNVGNGKIIFDKMHRCIYCHKDDWEKIEKLLNK